MELDCLYEDLALLDGELLFPEGSWSLGLIGNNQDGGRLLAGDNFWAADDFPLKEVQGDYLGPSFDLDLKSSRDDDPFEEWLDERVNLSEIDQLINSPDFENVIHDLEKSAIELLEEMEQQPSIESNDRCSSSLSGDEANSLGISEDAKETTMQKLDCCSPESLDQEAVTLVTIEPRDIEYSPSSSQASPSTDGTCNVEEPSTTSLPEYPCNVIIEQPDLVIDGPDIEITLVVMDDPKETTSSSSSLGSPSSSQKSARCARTRPVQKLRPKPYSRISDEDSMSSSSLDDQGYTPSGNRKERKRNQNRSAANRYRVKKRAEQSALDEEEAELAARNKELSQKVDQLASEIGYLKGLMRDMLISKGLIKK